MKELPENQTLAKQIDVALKGRVITEVFNATKYHKNTLDVYKRQMQTARDIDIY